MDEVKLLYDADMLVTAIAERLGIERHQVTDAIRLWHERHQLPQPADGRTRRADMPQKNLKPPLFQRVADEAKAQLDQDRSVVEIAANLGINRDTARAAIYYWYSSRNLPKPDLCKSDREIGEM